MKESLPLPVQTASPAEPARQPKLEPRQNGAAQIDRSFAHVPVAAASDGDDQGEGIVRLVRDIAGKLGIQAGQIRVRTGEMGHDAL